MKGLVRFSVYCLAALMCLSACRKEEGVSWDVDGLVPLMQANLSMHDLVGDSLLLADSSQALELNYKGSLYQLTLDTLLKVPDTTLTYHYSILLGNYNFIPGYVLINKNDVSTLNLDDLELNESIIGSGKLKFLIRNEIKERIEFMYRLPQVLKDGKPLEIKVWAPAADSATPGMYTMEVDMQGYSLKLNSTGNRVNRLLTYLYARTDPNGKTVNVLAGDSLSVFCSFESLKPSYARGYFGSINLGQIESETDFTFFKNVQSGMLQIERAQFQLQVANGIGTDARVYVKSLYGKNAATQQKVFLQAPIIQQAVNLNRASDLWPGSGQVTPSVYSMTFNSDNSNLKDFIENLPAKIGYKVDATTNPLGNSSAGNDFFYADKGLDIKYELNMPLNVKLDQLLLADTLDLALPDFEKRNQIKSLDITFYTQNSFPLSAQLNLVTLDDYNKTTALLTPIAMVISAAPIASSGKTQTSVKSEGKIHLEGEALEKLWNSHKLVLQAKLQTQGSSLVKLYQQYQISTRAVARINYRVN